MSVFTKSVLWEYLTFYVQRSGGSGDGGKYYVIIHYFMLLFEYMTMHYSFLCTTIIVNDAERDSFYLVSFTFLFDFLLFSRHQDSWSVSVWRLVSGLLRLNVFHIKATFGK